jgi:hypothetical protein
MMPTVETIIWLKEHNIEYKEITVKEAFEAGAENGFDLLRGSGSRIMEKLIQLVVVFRAGSNQ